LSSTPRSMSAGWRASHKSAAHSTARNLFRIVMAGLVPQLSGSFFVDKAHGVDSSVLKRLATF
jgi:hypothetical protein